VAEEFNAYFNRVPEKLLIDNHFNLNKVISNEKMDDSVTLDDDGIGNRMEYLKNFRLTEGDVEKIIMNLKNKRGRQGMIKFLHA